MLRNRPLVPSESFIAAHRIAPTASTSASPRDVYGARLHVLPAAFSDTREPRVIQPSLLDDLLRLSTHKLSAFLAEAAVLVLVLGILERFLAAHHLELRWLALILSLSATLLAASILVELTGTRRAGHS